MKLGTTLSVTLAAVGALALATPAHAQRRGGGGAGGGMNHGGGMMNHGGGMNNGGSMNHGGGMRPGMAGGGHFRGGHYYGGRYYGGSRVNFYFGGFGYPYFYGYPYYYGYPYGYAYYPVAAYTYDPQGVYEGRVVPDRNRTRRNTIESDGKEQISMEAQVQQQLAQAGYYHGAIDGVVGEGTRRAIRSYERANGLRVDGEIDNELLSTMGLG